MEVPEPEFASKLPIPARPCCLGRRTIGPGASLQPGPIPVLFVSSSQVIREFENDRQTQSNEADANASNAFAAFSREGPPTRGPYAGRPGARDVTASREAGR